MEKPKSQLPDDVLAIDVEDIPSAVLRRLIKEVRLDHDNPTRVYNRIHNRHNRGGEPTQPRDPDGG